MLRSTPSQSSWSARFAVEYLLCGNICCRGEELQLKVYRVRYNSIHCKSYHMSTLCRTADMICKITWQLTIKEQQGCSKWVTAAGIGCASHPRARRQPSASAQCGPPLCPSALQVVEVLLEDLLPVLLLFPTLEGLSFIGMVVWPSSFHSTCMQVHHFSFGAGACGVHSAAMGRQS